MNKKFAISTILATAMLVMGVFHGNASASEVITNCQFVYGGGQICGTHTPVDTAGESSLLFTASAALYGTGLLSLIVGKNADKFVPFLE